VEVAGVLDSKQLLLLARSPQPWLCSLKIIEQACNTI
jgi:hypothetical protein